MPEEAGNVALLGLQVPRRRGCREKVQAVRAGGRRLGVPHDADFSVSQDPPQLPPQPASWNG